MMPKLALIGCGKHMQKTLVPYLLQLEGYEVAVCVDSRRSLSKTGNADEPRKNMGL